VVRVPRRDDQATSPERSPSCGGRGRACSGDTLARATRSITPARREFLDPAPAGCGSTSDAPAASLGMSVLVLGLVLRRRGRGRVS
jgi:uncharacterized protein (TIGR03382 family)